MKPRLHAPLTAAVALPGTDVVATKTHAQTTTDRDISVNKLSASAGECADVWLTATRRDF